MRPRGRCVLRNGPVSFLNLVITTVRIRSISEVDIEELIMSVLRGRATTFTVALSLDVLASDIPGAPTQLQTITTRRAVNI